MSSAPNRLNPEFLELCKARLDGVEARLAAIERGWRYPDLWHVNQDLDCLAGWVNDIPELRARVERLGTRYAAIAFGATPRADMPSKFLPRPVVAPSTRPGHPASPISDEESAGMIAALGEQGFPLEDVGEPRALSRLLQIGRHAFHPGRLRRALATGLLPGGPAAQIDALLQAILLAMAERAVTTTGLRNAAKVLDPMFPQDCAWFERRFAALRRRLVNEGFLKRSGKSSWQRSASGGCARVRAAVELLHRLEQAGAQPWARDDFATKPAEDDR